MQSTPSHPQLLRIEIAAILTAAAFVLTVIVAPLAAAQHGTPEIRAIDPSQGPAGTTVVLNVSDADEIQSLEFGGYQIGFEITGEEELTFAVPTLSEGAYELRATNGWGAAVGCCFTIAASAPSTSAPSQPPSYDSCSEPRKNMQCNQLGTIAMDSHLEMRGEELKVVATITLSTNYAERNARWIMFSVRNHTEDGSPLLLSVDRFASASGDILVTRTEEKPAEINYWVHVLDTPVNTPITWEISVGSKERGAYQLEILVMPFDRAYTPMTDSNGDDVSLFSFTLIGVNKPAANPSAEGGGGFITGNKLPGFEAALLLGIVASTVFVLRRRGF